MRTRLFLIWLLGATLLEWAASSARLPLGPLFVPRFAPAALLPQSLDDDAWLLKKKKRAVLAALAGNSGSYAFLQDTGLSLGSSPTCGSATTSCTFNVFLPTAANSGLAVWEYSNNHVTISSVTGCGGTWVTGIGGAIDDSTNSVYSDLAYNITNTGSCTSLTITFSGNSGGAFPTVFEIAPPSGATISFDQVSTELDASCGSSCTLPPFNSADSNALTETDAVVVFTYPQYAIAGTTGNTPSRGSLNGCSSPYIEDYGGNCIALNVASGALTGTAQQCMGGTCPTTGYADFTAIAFKSSYSNFTVSPSAIWTVPNMSMYSNGLACSGTGCSLTIPSTTSGNGGILWALTGTTSQVISSATVGGSSLIVPTGSNTCQIEVSGVGSMSCAYIDSLPASATSVSIDTNTSATFYFHWFEFHKSSGSISLDAHNSTSNTSTSATPPGQSLTLAGTSADPDIVFQGILIPGGADTCEQSVFLVPYPYNAWTNCTGQVSDVSADYVGAVGYLPNVTSMPAFDWSIYGGTAQATAVAGMAFK
jgi:hypothetical protein